MTNRSILYDEEQIDPFDMLWQFKDFLASIGALELDLTGEATSVVAGFGATATAPTSLTINLTAGRIYQQSAIDSTAYGALASDSSIVQQQGIVVAQPIALSTSGLTAGQSRWALIQATFSQQDAVRSGDPTGGVLNYYDAADPTQWFQGPNGNGQSQPTERQATVSVSVVYGTPAATGSEVPPNPSAGCVPLYLIDLAYGQTAISQGQILTAGPSVGANVPSNYPYAPFLAGLLNQHHKGITGQAPQIDLTSEVKNVLPYANMASVRIRLAANATFYVNGSTGSDANGGTSGSPWATLTHAYTYIALNYDLNGYGVTVSVADGSYTALTATNAIVGGGSINFVGDTATPDNCVISSAGVGVLAENGAQVGLSGFKITSSGSNGIEATGPGSLIAINGPIDFAACAVSQIVAIDGGEVDVDAAAYAISGGATSHFAAEIGARIIFNTAPTITLSNTPAYSTAFADADRNSTILAAGITFAGTGATGVRYRSILNAVIDTQGGGASYFPGSSAGVTATGGEYN